MRRALTHVSVGAALAVGAAPALAAPARSAHVCQVPPPTHRVTFIYVTGREMSCAAATTYAEHVAAHGTAPHGFSCNHRVHERDVRWECIGVAGHRHKDFVVVYRVH